MMNRGPFTVVRSTPAYPEGCDWMIREGEDDGDFTIAYVTGEEEARIMCRALNSTWQHGRRT